MAIMTELVTKFTFKGSTKPLNDFNASLTKSIGLIAKSSLAIGAAVVAGAFWVENTLKNAEAQKRLATETGVSIEKIQELGYAASVSGSDAAALEGSLVSLSSKIGQAAQTGSADFSRLGISVRDAFGNVKKADQILVEVANAFKRLNLSIPEQQSFADALGIDKSLLQLMRKSGDEIDRLRAKARALGVVTKQQSEQIEDFNNSVTTLKFGLSALQKQIAIGLSPTLKEIADKFTDWLIANKDLIKDGMEKLFKIVGALGAAIYRIVVFVKDLIEATVGWKVAVIALVAVLAFLNPIAALITGILIVIDDLIVAFQGGKSVIRDFFKEFFGIDITPILKDLVQGFKNAVFLIKSFFEDLFNFIFGRWDKLGKTIEAVKSVFGIGKSEDNTQIQQTSVIPKSSVPISSAVNNTSNSNSVNQNIKIEIKTNDPVAAGKAVHDTMQNQMQNANSQLNNGGR